MIKGKLATWTNIDDCQNLLFFAQLANELLFDFSIPSNRLPTLNSHYLCYDASEAIKYIDNHGVPEGTLKPIIEELYTSLSKDVLFKSSEYSPLDFFVKYCNGKYRRTSRPDELNHNEYKQLITALSQRFFADQDYFVSLKEKIIQIIANNLSSEQGDLFQLTKSLLTELVNSGYHPNYLYDHVNRVFFRKKQPISSPNDIQLFFDPLTLKLKKYTDIFIVKKEAKNYFGESSWLHFFNNYKLRTSDPKESAFVTQLNEGEVILTMEQQALDPYRAVELSKYLFVTNASFFRLYNHNLDFKFNRNKCGVYDEHDTFVEISESVSAVQKTKTPSNQKILDSFNVLKGMLTRKSLSQSNYKAFLNAINFHYLSLDSSSVQNQLLDMWAIFEALLDIKNSHSTDRINQICKYLVPIEKMRYLYALFCELTQDIKNNSPSFYRRITDNCDDSFSCIQKICCFALLEEYETERTMFFQDCNDIPLLRERILYFNSMLSSHDKIYSFVEKHSDRVKWQIMRIYRNRNLIIHNGESMPYMSLLVENLHSYVDDLLDFTITSLSSGYSLDSMYQQLYAQECKWLEEFNTKGVKTTRNTIETFLRL